MNESVARIDHPVIAISIGGSYRHGMSNLTLYHSTRGTWRVDRRRAEKARYAFSVYQGVIREVYEILHWLPAGSTEHSFGPSPNRYEFEGRVAQDKIRDKYVGKLMPERSYGQPIRYYNC